MDGTAYPNGMSNRHRRIAYGNVAFSSIRYWTLFGEEIHHSAFSGFRTIPVLLSTVCRTSQASLLGLFRREIGGCF